MIDKVNDTENSISPVKLGLSTTNNDLLESVEDMDEDLDPRLKAFRLRRRSTLSHDKLLLVNLR